MRGVPAWTLGLALLVGCSAPVSLEGCETSGGLVPLCGLQNPEDLVFLPGGDWLLASQGPAADGTPGSLLALRVSDGSRVPLWPHPPGTASLDASRPTPGWGDPACPGPPDASLFAPHGVDLARPRGAPALLLVVNHGGREAVELFEVGVAEGAPALWWRGCALPGPGFLNDVAALPGGGFVASRMFDGRGGAGTALGLLRLLLGQDTGRVLEWTPDAGWRELPGSAAPAPNGVAVSADGERVFAAVWGPGGLIRVRRHGDPERAAMGLPFHADNLSWTPEGRLLVAGQQGSIGSILACRRLEAGTCGVAFAVAAIDPDSLQVESVLEHSGRETMGMATVAVERDGEIWLGTAFGDRVARFRRD